MYPVAPGGVLSLPGGCVPESPWAVNSSGSGRRDGGAPLGKNVKTGVVKLCLGQFVGGGAGTQGGRSIWGIGADTGNDSGIW